MPPKRRSTASQRASQQQSTLSFAGKNSKVTKTASPRSSTRNKKDAALFEDVAQAELKTPADSDVEGEVDPVQSEIKTEDVLGGRAEESELGAVGGLGGSGWVGDEEKEARKIPQTQINRYWREKERERKAPRIHQRDLSVHEKILREWDMSGQFGPCIGIARLKRWKRANMLGLNPPIEVLAVLLKELENGDAKSQRAYVDELMSSRFVET